MKPIDSSIFKAYDVRGVFPEQINEDTVYKIAQAYAKFVGPKKVALGRDVRLSGPKLMDAIKRGLVDHGVSVVDIGVITTDMYYFASAAYGYDGAIIVTASHNPREYNGIKMVRGGAVAISGDTGIQNIKELVAAGYSFKSDQQGLVETKDVSKDYLAKCLSFIDKAKIKPLKVVANAMFGLAVQNISKLGLPIEIVPLNELPDGSFPKGAPDPFLPENRSETQNLIRDQKADLGAAWDGDADRFFLYDENGRWIPGYYLTAFLGKYFCKRYPKAKIIYDTRTTWATIDEVYASGGIPLLNKVGHSFIKERMRSEDALFAGEGSGHFYFKDFFYADNGLIPFLIVLEIISESGAKVSELFNSYFEKYHISGEVNTQLESQEQAAETLHKIEQSFKDAKFDYTDGLSIEYSDWRANIRSSNTQPLIRVNVEAKSPEVLKQKTEELIGLIK